MTSDDASPASGQTAGARAADTYNSLLRSEPGLACRSSQALREAHQEVGLLIRGRPLCNVLRPRFISAEELEHLQEVAGVIWQLFERLGDELLGSDYFLDLIQASEQERLIWEIDPGYPGFTTTSRLDSFMINGSPRFVEYNAESPASIGFCDVLTDIFRQLPVMRSWPGNENVSGFEARSALTDVLIWAYRAWGGSDIPSVAIIDWEEVLTKRDFELCADYFRSLNWPVVITDPRKLHYHGGSLWSGNQKITLVYRRVLLHELLEHAAEARDLLDAYRDGAVCMVNSARSKLLHKKAMLALLSDPDSGLTLRPDERAIVDEVIPWTRLVRPGKTTYGSENADLMAHLAEYRERMVLKPSDDYGGRGVILGWEVSPDEWERALAEAMEKAYVVQERVEVPEYEYPVWNQEGISLTPLFTDTNPLLFRGKLGGVLTRVSGSALLNVTAGTGSTTPTFLLHDRQG